MVDNKELILRFNNLTLTGMNSLILNNMSNLLPLYIAIDEYLKSDNPLDAVMVGLIYIVIGDKESGIIKLDEFYIMNPNLILSEGVKTFLKTQREENFEDL